MPVLRRLPAKHLVFQITLEIDRKSLILFYQTGGIDDAFNQEENIDKDTEARAWRPVVRG